MDEKRYDYNARWSTVVFVGGFFGLCSVVLANQAATNDRGVVIEHFIRLGREGATAFYWCLAAGSVLFVLVAIGIAIRRVVYPRKLVIDATGIWLPHGAFQMKLARVEFSEVIAFSEFKVRGQISLRLRTLQKNYSISESLLASRRDYDDIKSTIGSSVPRPFTEGT